MPVMIMVIKSISGREADSLKNKTSQSLITTMLAPVQAAKAIPVGICLIAMEKNQALAKPKTR